MPVDFKSFLVSSGRITTQALDRSVKSADQTRESFVAVLSKLGVLTEREVVNALADFYNLPIAASETFPSIALYADTINVRFLSFHHVLPLALQDNALTVAIADPGNREALTALEVFSGCHVVPHVAALTDLDMFIKRLYREHETPSEEITLPETADADDASRLSDLASEAPVIRLVNNLLVDAYEAGASDIHIEPFVDRVRIRYRLDGMLHEIESHPKNAAPAIISRIKVMARLNIVERRLPQDGRLHFAARGNEIDVRVSTSPTSNGESVVLRLLDQGGLKLDLNSLGFDDPLKEAMDQALQKPYGIILVTGPTGSGKTTTLYAALSALNTSERKILTIEDPIEYQLDGINQQAIQAQIGRTFAGALRSFLRQDPDVIMVGEIRDSETAQIAVQAALTGHLILSTLHTNNAASAITRLQDMGIPEYLLTSTVNAILGQRLVRCLCRSCKEPYTLEPKLAAELFGVQTEAPLIYRPRGCPECHGTGYRGRTTVVEFLEVTEDIRHLVMDKTEARKIEQVAVKGGMRSMYRHGIEKVLAGETSLDEVLRVTQDI